MSFASRQELTRQELAFAVLAAEHFAARYTYHHGYREWDSETASWVGRPPWTRRRLMEELRTFATSDPRVGERVRANIQSKVGLAYLTARVRYQMALRYREPAP